MAQPSSEIALAGRRAGALSRLLARWRRRSAAPELATFDPTRALPAEPPPDPATVRQWLWGPGFVIPGGSAHVLGLVQPFGLGPAMTMLDVSAGLGGPARAVAEAFNIYSPGLERDPDLARLGMAMSVGHRLARRAPVSLFDPESFDLPRGHYDCMLSREATYAVRNKERFLRVLMQGLKPQGALVLTEFVLDRSVADRRQLADWAPLPDHPPLLWTLERYEDCLRSLGFEIRVSADISAAYRALIIAGWTGLARRDALRRLPRGHFAPIIDEAERCMRTVQALDCGALKMVRAHAVARRG